MWGFHTYIDQGVNHEKHSIKRVERVYTSIAATT